MRRRTYNNKTSIPPAIWFKFDGNLKDEISQIEATRPFPVSYAQGVRGQSAYFDGGLPGVFDMDTATQASDFSICFWANLDSIVNYAGIIKIGDYLIHNWDMPDYFYLLAEKGGITTSRICYRTPILPVGQFVHFAIVFNPDSIEMYCNGLKMEYYTQSGSPYGGKSGKLEIGASGTSRYRGYFDDLKVFDKALTEEEVKLVYKD